MNQITTPSSPSAAAHFRKRNGASIELLLRFRCRGSLQSLALVQASCDSSYLEHLRSLRGEPAAHPIVKRVIDVWSFRVSLSESLRCQLVVPSFLRTLPPSEFESFG